MPARPTKTPSQPNQSVIGAMQCLEMVAASSEPVGGRELARSLGIDRVRANRLLMTLAHCGVLERTAVGKYRPGAGIHALAALATEGSSLQRVAIPHVRQWWSDGFAVTLGVLWREYICYIVRAVPGKPLEESVGGRRGPACESSAGLMLLASLRAAALSAMPTDTPPAVREELSLKQLVARTRRDGYARLRFSDGSISVGCPIGEPPIAAIAVSRKGLDDASIAAVVTRLRATAAAIDAALTHPA